MKKVTLLCKSLLPLPEKHSGLTDKELRYRKRCSTLFPTKKSVIFSVHAVALLKSFENIYSNNTFLEVETPILQNQYGGAEARPFLTHLNALDYEMYLRISLEINLKKLVIGGMERVFELGKSFVMKGLTKLIIPNLPCLKPMRATGLQ